MANKPISFSNSRIKIVINNFVCKKAKKDKIFIHSDEIEVLLLSISSIDTEEIHNLKQKEKSFFISFLKQLKKSIEDKSGKLLFLTIREGDHIIIDSWHATYNDWEIESKSRKNDFLILRDNYFKIKEKFPAIKSIEDYISVVNMLTNKQLISFFKSQKKVNQIKRIISIVKNL